MGKSNNPAKRANQEREIKAKKAGRTKKASGFMKFILVLILSVAVCGPFFAGLTNLAVTPAPAAPTSPDPTMTTLVAPVGQ